MCMHRKQSLNQIWENCQEYVQGKWTEVLSVTFNIGPSDSIPSQSYSGLEKSPECLSALFYEIMLCSSGITAVIAVSTLISSAATTD